MAARFIASCCSDNVCAPRELTPPSFPTVTGGEEGVIRPRLLRRCLRENALSVGHGAETSADAPAKFTGPGLSTDATESLIASSWGMPVCSLATTLGVLSLSSSAQK